MSLDAEADTAVDNSGTWMLLEVPNLLDDGDSGFLMLLFFLHLLASSVPGGLCDQPLCLWGSSARGHSAMLSNKMTFSWASGSLLRKVSCSDSECSPDSSETELPSESLLQAP